MSVGDDVEKYLVLLVIAPGVGVVFSGVGAAVQLRERRRPLDAAPEPGDGPDPRSAIP